MGIPRISQYDISAGKRKMQIVTNTAVNSASHHLITKAFSEIGISF
jgi:hypothetical protein